MSEWITEALCIMMYLFEGYCIQFFFCRFARPKQSQIKGAKWAVSIVWILIRFGCNLVFSEMVNTMLVLKLLCSAVTLFIFCLCWYQGTVLLKIFMVVQFISLRELAFLASYSLNYIGDVALTVLVRQVDKGNIWIEYLPVTVSIISCLTIAFMQIIQGALLLGSLRKIVKNYNYEKNMNMGREAVFYLLPSVAGVLVAVLVRMLIIAVEEGNPVLLYDKYPALYVIIPLIALVLLVAIVFSFRVYQDMVSLQEERAEKIVLASQNAQLQSSMVEMEHLYDGIRSVRHDMKNHMAVLHKLIQEKYRQDDSKEDEEIQNYFNEMYQSVEQLDIKVHTGNPVSDAVIGSKFRYAEKQVKGIRLYTDDFMVSEAAAIKAYDIGIILSNGLDNAIEACMRMREKNPDAEAYIALRSFKAKGMYFIEIENSFDGMARFDKDSGFPISTKEDKEVHGIGLKNIRKCAVKYGGDIDFIVEGNKFILSVMVKGGLL